MNQQRDAILGYAQELQAYYIQLIENNTVIEHRYGFICDDTSNEEQVDQIMLTLFLKKSFWINGSTIQNTIKGLQAIAPNFSHAC